MQRIIIDARESGTSTGRYVDKLIEYLHVLKPDFDILLIAKKHRLAFLKKIAPNFTLVETPYQEFTFGEQIGLKRQIDALKPDLVHFPMVQQPVFYSGPVVTTMQDLTTLRFRNPTKNAVIFGLKQTIYAWVNKKVAHKSVVIITPSQFVKEDIARFSKVPPNKITVIYDAADPIHEPTEPINALVNKRFILYVGRAAPHKNLERLIQAFKALQTQHADCLDCYLVLAGKKDANYQCLEQSIEAQQIKRIVLTDFVSEGTLRWLYQHCTAYIFPSLSEGFGLPGLEAMLHNVPVISSNATCLPEIYGEAAHYFDPLDVSSIKVGINEVLTNCALRQKLVDAGKKQVKRYAWLDTAEQTFGVYKQVLDENKTEL